jgi:acyl-CoA thioester hydrolase
MEAVKYIISDGGRPRVDPFKLEVVVQVRFRDVDSLGHINNAVYFTYCEIARNAYWTKLFGTRRLALANFILARAEMDYRAQANEERNILVGIRVPQIGNTSFVFEYRILEEETRRLLAEGRSVQVTFDYQKNKKVPVPDLVRDRIVSFEGAENVTIRGGAGA